MNELFLSVEWAQMDCGTLTEETAEPLILKRFPERLHESVHRLLFSWSQPQDTIDGMEALVKELKEKGYRLFLLSNASTAQHRYWPEIPVSRELEGKLISCDVHVVKPNPEIYRIFTAKFDLQPEECLFIDDAAANAAAAIQCGWQGIVFHGSTAELRGKLEKLGIL